MFGITSTAISLSSSIDIAIDVPPQLLIAVNVVLQKKLKRDKTLSRYSTDTENDYDISVTLGLYSYGYTLSMRDVINNNNSMHTFNQNYLASIFPFFLPYA